MAITDTSEGDSDDRNHSQSSKFDCLKIYFFRNGKKNLHCSRVGWVTGTTKIFLFLDRGLSRQCRPRGSVKKK